jgi:hypothetical protein
MRIAAILNLAELAYFGRRGDECARIKRRILPDRNGSTYAGADVQARNKTKGTQTFFREGFS